MSDAAGSVSEVSEERHPAPGPARGASRLPQARRQFDGAGILRAIVVPLAVAQLLIHQRSGALGAPAWAPDLFIALVVVAIVPRRAGIRFVPAALFGGWAAISLTRPNSETFPTELVVAALLGAVALRGQVPHGLERDRAWSAGPARLAGFAVVLAAALQAVSHTTSASVALGFGLGVVLLAAADRRAAHAAAVGAGRLVFVLVFGVGSAGARVGIYPVGIRPVAAGLVFGLLALSFVAKARWAPVLVPVAVAASAWFLALPGSFYVLVTLPAALVAVDAVPRLVPPRLREQRGLLLWAVALASLALQFTTVDSAVVLVALGLAGGALALAQVSERARSAASAPTLAALGARAAAAASAAVERAVWALQVVFDVVVRPPARWFAQATSTTEEVSTRPSTLGGKVLDSYLLPVLGWVVLAIGTQVRASQLSVLYTDRPGLPFSFILRHPFDATGRIGWGTGDYWAVADHGYRLSEHREAVFPVVALLVRWVSSTFHIGLVSAQVAVASASGLLASVLFFTLMGRLGVFGRVRVVAQLFFLLFPWNFLSYGYGYSDPTLLALVLAAFVLIEMGWPLLAGLVGAVATATRPNSLPLVPSLLLFELLRSGAVAASAVDPTSIPWWRPDRRVVLHLGRMRPAQWSVLVSVMGVVAYSWWLRGHAGDPLYWLHDQSYYGHGSVLSPSTWFKSLFLDDPRYVVTNGLWATNEVLTGCVVIAAVLLTPTVWRRFGAAYGTFVAGVVAIAWVAPRGMAPGARYLLPALPFFAIVAAEWLAPRRRVLVPLLAWFGAAGFLAVTAFVASNGTWLEW